ncbi:hypothetical protein HC928_02165 [bacterium]|nr:hypothetical protein [bacterium]
MNSPEAMLQARAPLFHAPVGQRDQVQLVQLPLLPSRLLSGALPTDVQAHLEQRRNRRTDFLSRLTRAEQELAEAFTQHPYVMNQDLADILGKEKRTIENQFASIYGKLSVFLDAWDDDADKRAVLRDLLLGRD